MTQNFDIWKILWLVAFFPTVFQADVASWVWTDQGLDLGLTVAKRILLLLPVFAVLGCLWVSLACLATVIVRQDRRLYVSRLILCWWDLARVLFRFWGGFFTFAFMVLASLVAVVRLLLLGVWLSIQDFILVPFRALKGVSDSVSRPGTPWIAVGMTLVWCALEAFVFTFVMRALVVDTLSGLTGVDLDETFVQIILYMMLITFVVGSYAIVASLEKAVRERDVRMIALIALVEMVALIFEVLFLYREFVDALVPWFAQHAGEGFELGIFFTIAIAGCVWAGIRGMTWFLFAAHGTPPIMAIIQRTGLRSDGSGKGILSSLGQKNQFGFIKEAIDHIRKDIESYEEWGEKLLSAFILPPLQVVAVVINFLSMLVAARTIFELPFKSYKDMISAQQNIKGL